jgi:L-asparaginase II
VPHAQEPIVRVVRSGLEESRHRVDVAVCDADGRLVASAGHPHRRLYARSCMKPLQGAVSLAAIDDPGLTDEQVAIVCSSHNGEPVHVAAMRSVLRRGRIPAAALRCPPGWPLDPATMARAGRKSRALHNCSGKHAGMLLACVRAGWDPADYLRPGHPLQRRIRRAVLRATGLDTVEIGVDGCGVPVHAMPLSSMATIYARLADPERLGDLAPTAARAGEAMLARPYLVGGRGRLDTAVMRTTRDVVVKEGAEALVCAAVLASGLGIAVKVSDGGERATGPALIAALLQVDALTEAQLADLADHAEPAVTGGGRAVGRVTADVRLRRHDRGPQGS